MTFLLAVAFLAGMGLVYERKLKEARQAVFEEQWAAYEAIKELRGHIRLLQHYRYREPDGLHRALDVSDEMTARIEQNWTRRMQLSSSEDRR